MTRTRAVVFLVLANLFWAGNFVFGAFVTEEIPPVSLTFWRWAFALAPLVLLAWLIERPDWRAALREWKLHLLQSALGLSGYTLFLYSALGQTGPVTASVISAINPAVIALAAALVLRERLRAPQLAGILIAFAGVVVVLTGGDLGMLVRDGFRGGDLLVVGSVLVWTAYSVLGRRLTTPPITATAVQAGFAVATLAPVVAVMGLSLPTSTTGAIGLAYIVLFPSMLGYAFWNLGSARLGPSVSGQFLNLLPVFTVAIAVVLGQSLSWPVAIGGAFVLAGVALALRAPRRARPDSSTDPAETRRRATAAP